MPLLFTCPHCQSKTQVEDRYSGQTGECFSCGKPIAIPDFAAAQSETAAGQEAKPKSNRHNVSVLAAAGVVLTMLVCLVFAVVRFGGSSVSRLQEMRLRNSSIDNLQAIAQALNAYADDHGTYPPAALQSKTGRSLHSWRVLILPYLGESELYDSFDLSKPWDHEVNLDAAAIMPSVYAHPADVNSSGGQSGYFLITGNQTIFPTGKPPLSPLDVTDNHAQTILVVSGAPSALSGIGSWAQPVDFDFAAMQGQIGGTVGIEVGGWLTDGVTVATVDGRGHFLSKEMAPATFNSLVTPTGSEPLPDDTLD